MSTAFYVFVNVMVPLSAAFLFLLLLPFPQRIRRVINNVLTKIFLIPGPIGLSTISSVLLVLGAFFAHVTYSLYDYTNKFSSEVSKHEPPKVSLSEHRLVRAQRNFWVGLLLVVFWTVLSMLLRLSKRIVEQEAELATYRAKAKKSAPVTDSSRDHVGIKHRDEKRKVSAAIEEEEGVDEDARETRDTTNTTDRGRAHYDEKRTRDTDRDREGLTQRKGERKASERVDEKHERATATDREAVEGQTVGGRKKNEGH